MCVVQRLASPRPYERETPDAGFWYRCTPATPGYADYSDEWIVFRSCGPGSVWRVSAQSLKICLVGEFVGLWQGNAMRKTSETFAKVLSHLNLVRLGHERL
jgi:hypothetical protein